MAGQKFDTPEVSNTPLIHYLLTHTAMAGRPGAGPALALSLVLVAIVCVFTGLCYAELASMIPIAGSAYTYTYATLGELVAWIIGWDLILEYAFSNMSVSVGFAAHIEALLEWFGIHPALKWISPAYLPTGLQDFSGRDLYAPGWHFGFNIPAFLVVMVLTVVLVRGIRESARTNNILVLVKIVAILAFIFAAASFIKPVYWHPFMPNGWTGMLSGGSIIFFTYIGFDSVSTAFFGCGGDGIESDVGEEDDRTAGEHARPAIRHERDASTTGLMKLAAAKINARIATILNRTRMLFVRADSRMPASRHGQHSITTRNAGMLKPKCQPGA